MSRRLPDRPRQRPAAAPTVNIVGVQGYAELLVRQAELLSVDHLCRLGGIVIDRRYTDPNRYDQLVADHRAAGWTVFSTFDDLLTTLQPQSNTSDLLVLPVPIPLHRPMTEAAVAAGYNVLCEKPAAGSVRDLDAMDRAATAAGRSLWFGYQHVLSRSMTTLFDQIAAGAADVITSITVYASWPRSEQYYQRSGWAGKLYLDQIAVLDSPIQNAMAHFLQAALHLASLAGWYPTTVDADHLRVNDIQTADTQVLRIATSGGNGGDGPPIFAALAHSAGIHRDPVIHVTGTQGSLRWSFPDKLESSADGRSWRTIYSGSLGEHLYGLAIKAAVLRLSATTDPVIRVENIVDSVRARMHTQVVEAAFGAMPRRTFPPRAIAVAHRNLVCLDGQVYRTVAGLDATLAKAVTDRALLREVSTPWPEAILQVSRSIAR